MLRSAALILLPTSFISLVAWATAGSATGSTTDPIRATFWIWLGAHHIPFNLSLPPSGVAGYLSYLPLGALVLPFLAIRSSFARVAAKLDNDPHFVKGARTTFTFFYLLLALIIALVSKSQTAAAQLYMIPIILIPFVYLTTMTVGRRIVLTVPVNLGSRIVALLLGASSIALGISIFAHLGTVENLTRVLEPGLFGGLLLLLLNILYLPNAAVATFSYFAGSGFSVGAGSLISPITHKVAEIPAIPLLGAIPDSAHPFALFAIVLPILAGAVLASWTVALSTRILIQSFVISIFSVALLGFLASGTLITDVMAGMGVSLWLFPLVVAAEFALGIGAAILIPQISLSSRKRES